MARVRVHLLGFVAAGLLAGSLSEAHAQNNSAPTNPSAGDATSPVMGEPSAMPTPRRVQDTSAPLVDTEPAIDPAKDQHELAAQGAERPRLGSDVAMLPSHVYADDWWSHARPSLELHGYFRTRGEMYHNFSLNRSDAVGSALWPRPLDDSYQVITQDGAIGETRAVNLCGSNGVSQCNDKTQAFANLRLRLNPELHISDNLRVMAQIDALDNLVLGSTPAGRAASLTDTQVNNGLQNTINVNRAWAEYLTPVGQLRFGRMPTHWGMGMLYNSGDGIDQDYQSNNDRIMFVTGLRSIDLYAGGSWDFANSGPTSNQVYGNTGGQPYNVANRANAAQWTLFVARRTNPELQRLRLAQGKLVLNAGLFNVFRTQELDLPVGATGVDINATTNNGLERRGLNVYTPDLWIQVLWNKLRVEVEAAAHLGSVEQTGTYRLDPNTGKENMDSVAIRQFGVTGETEFKAVEDKLRLKFGSGWSTGDPWARSLTQNDAFSGSLNDGKGPITTFQFNPAYNIDLIFYRRMLTQVQGTYYFRPNVEYDFIRNANGQKFGGGAAMIWSRASEFVQAPGNKRDLGVEVDLSLYYQAKDGSLNDDPNRMGGFYAMLQYGAFFPLGGLQYASSLSGVGDTSVSTAQVVRLHLGVVF